MTILNLPCHTSLSLEHPLYCSCWLCVLFHMTLSAWRFVSWTSPLLFSSALFLCGCLGCSDSCFQWLSGKWWSPAWRCCSGNSLFSTLVSSAGTAPTSSPSFISGLFPFLQFLLSGPRQFCFKLCAWPRCFVVQVLSQKYPAAVVARQKQSGCFLMP